MTQRNRTKPCGDRGEGRHRLDHMQIRSADIVSDDGLARVLINDSESPLAWLARRKGRDGAPMISAEQFLAGERLRCDFTFAGMTPRVTSNWGVAGAGGRQVSPGEMTDRMVSARQRLRAALDAVGPEFAGLLMDVCCFLRGLEDVERQRSWPQRTAKIVLQLGLDRLARHYGLVADGRGKAGGINARSAEGGGDARV